MIDEHATWERARGGDSASFGLVFDHHYDRVYRQAWRLMRTVQDAEDVTALVFLEAWRRRSSVRVVEGSVLPWLLVTTNYVAANASRTHRRHRLAMGKLPTQDHVEDHADEVLGRLGASSDEARLRAAFARLSKNDRDVLTLCVVNDFSMGQAADTLGIPVGTVKSRLSRAKERLAHLTGSRDRDDSSIALLGEHK
jgi:RNA polymerase sigma factor (sigma-70 family)